MERNGVWLCLFLFIDQCLCCWLTKKGVHKLNRDSDWFSLFIYFGKSILRSVVKNVIFSSLLFFSLSKVDWWLWWKCECHLLSPKNIRLKCRPYGVDGQGLMAYYDCIWRIEYEMIFNQNVDGSCLFMSWIYVHRDLSNWKKEETQFDARTKQRLFTHDWIIKMLPMLDFSCRLSKCPFHTKIDLSEIIILCKCAFKISVLFFGLTSCYQQSLYVSQLPSAHHVHFH